VFDGLISDLLVIRLRIPISESGGVVRDEPSFPARMIRFERVDQAMFVEFYAAAVGHPTFSTAAMVGRLHAMRHRAPRESGGAYRTSRCVHLW